MGIYFYYVNDSKRQYFCIDPAGFDVKLYALGRNLGSRALSYLILNDRDGFAGIDPHALIGSWIGDRVYVTGDDYHENFETICSTYEDVAQQIVELIVAINPFDLIEYGGINWFCDVMDHNGERITVTAKMRKRISHEFRLANLQHPRDDLQRAIAALRI